MVDIALFGGAFDPIHCGHVAVATQAMAMLNLDQVHFIPCAAPVHKASCQASPWQRAAMIALAIHQQPGLVLNTCELERATPSYAIETIENFIACHDAPLRLSWLLGVDALAGLRQWHRWRDILGLVDLIVVNRPGQDVDGVGISELEPLLHAHGHTLHLLTLPPYLQSSTAIRRHTASLDTVPAWVRCYIEAEGLYTQPLRSDDL